MSSWVASLILGLAVFAATIANRPLMVLTNDEVPQAFIPWMTLRGYGMDFAPVIAKYGSPDEPLRPYLTRAGGRVLSIYPYASGWLALPLSGPQFVWMDRRTPGWDAEGPGLLEGLRGVGKRTSAAMVALTAFLLHRLLVAWGFGGWAIAATLVAVLGSDLWVVASQATWQHGPAALCLTASLVALSPANGERPGERRLFVAGLFAALLAAVRVPDVVLSATIAIVVFRLYRSRAFFIAPVVVGAALIGWNMAVFGHPAGGQALLAGQVESSFKVSWWDPSWLAGGLLGTLVSPNRGLLVFSPWCAAAAFAWRARDLDPRARWMLPGLAAFWLMVGSYPAWWAGHCFGPRYWTEAMPLFAAPLAWALRSSSRNSSVLFAFLLVGCVWSIAVQTVGAICYPSTWNMDPANVDLAHERLWDWKDTELLRCLTEGPFREPTR